MANYEKNWFSDPKNPLPNLLKAEDVAKWQPTYTGWTEVRDFANKPVKVTFFDSKTGFPVAPEGLSSKVIKDRAQKISGRSVVAAFAKTSGVTFNVADYGVSNAAAAFIPKGKTLVPSAPWDMKLEYSPAEIKIGIDHLKSLLPKMAFPTSFGSFDQPVFKPEDMGNWTVAAATNLIPALAPNADPRVLQAIQQGAFKNTYEILLQMPAELHVTTQKVLSGVSQLSAVASTQFWGSVDWESGAKGVFMTVDSLRDGMVTKAEAESIGSSTGAFAGGAIGSIFGPVGTALGSAIGSLIGKLFGQLMGEKEGASPESIHAREQKLEQEKAQEALAKEFQSMQDQLYESRWKEACQRVQASYYSSLEAYMRLVALMWAEMEYEVGWRFDLRWFDPNPGVNFDLLLPAAGYKGHVNAENFCSTHSVTKEIWVRGPDYYKLRTGIMNPGHIGEERVVKEAISKECHMICPHSYGCPYPTLTVFQTGSRTFQAGMDSYYQGTGSRVVDVFAARGFIWLDPASRPSCDDLFKSKANMEYLLIQLDQLNSAAKLIQMDVERTAIAVKVEHDLWANGSAYKAYGLDTGLLGKIELQQGVKNGKVKDPKVLAQPGYSNLRTSYNMNRALFYGGLGAAGLALYDKFWRK